MKKILKISILLLIITYMSLSYFLAAANAQSSINDQRSLDTSTFNLPECPAPLNEKWRSPKYTPKKKEVTTTPFIRDDQQYISEDSPLAITVIAAHIEYRSPRNLPRQTADDYDPADFVHIKNISDKTIDLSDYYISDSSRRRVSLRICAGNKDVYLKKGQEIRVIFSGDSMKYDHRDSLKGVSIIVSEGLSRHGEKITIYDPSGRPIAIAMSGTQDQDEITVFSKLDRGKILSANRARTRSNPRELNKVSHNIADFN